MLHDAGRADAGEVFAWGDGRAGQLGQGVQRCRYTPLAIAALRGKYVKHVAAGHYHSAAVSGIAVVSLCPIYSQRPYLLHFDATIGMSGTAASGHLYMWGAAQNGRLGLSTREQRVLVPTLVEERPWGDRTVVHVACGADFTLGIVHPPMYPSYAWAPMPNVPDARAWRRLGAAVTDDGSVYSTGTNAFGQLGLGDTTDRSEFTLVEALVGLDIHRVACGSGHAAAITGACWEAGAFPMAALSAKTPACSWPVVDGPL